MINEFLPIWISPDSFFVISETPSTVNPSAVMSISLPSAPIWIDPSEFFVITAAPSIFKPSETISMSSVSPPICISPEEFFCSNLSELISKILFPELSLLVDGFRKVES